jgi:hypothetical protein
LMSIPARDPGNRTAPAVTLQTIQITES